MPTSAHWEETNSPQISIKPAYSAGGQGRPPLQGRARVVVGADDSVGPLGSPEFAGVFRIKRCILPGRCVPASGRPTSVTLLCRERLRPASTPTMLYALRQNFWALTNLAGKIQENRSGFLGRFKAAPEGGNRNPPGWTAVTNFKKSPCINKCLRCPYSTLNSSPSKKSSYSQ